MLQPSQASQQKIGAIRLSLLTAFCLALFKFAIGWVTQSVAILSLAIDSMADVLSSLFNLVFLTKAEKPADEDHHFGHGKFENFGSLLQGGILLAMAGFTVTKAIEKLMMHAPVIKPGLGIMAVVVSFVVSFVVGYRVRRIGNDAQSDLLKAEATHLLMDGHLYLVALLGLIFSRFGWAVFDPIACFIVAGYVVWTAAKILKSSFDALTDKALSDQENEAIERIIKDHHPSILGYDHLRTRRGGTKKFISFRLHLCPKISLQRAHDILDHVEKEIEAKISYADVIAHAEPTREDCSKHEHELQPRHFSKTD